jgi:predicted GIY-YIG superfamily endonuclease
MRFFNHRRHGHIIGSVYLVHFARRYHGKQHYLGFSTNVPARVKAHRAGRVLLYWLLSPSRAFPGAWCAPGNKRTDSLNRTSSTGTH